MNYYDSESYKIYKLFRDELDRFAERAEKADEIKKIGTQLVRGACYFRYMLCILDALSDKKENKEVAANEVRGCFRHFCLTLADSIEKLNES